MRNLQSVIGYKCKKELVYISIIDSGNIVFPSLLATVNRNLTARVLFLHISHRDPFCRNSADDSSAFFYAKSTIHI